MKFIKRGSRVNVKLTLPKDIHWKIFRQLILDLQIDEQSFHEIHHAIRHRDIEKLRLATRFFNPHSMIEAYGEDGITTNTGIKINTEYDFYRFYQAGVFLKKFPFTGSDTKTPAFKTFIKLEEHCALFNHENYRALVSLNERHPNFYGILDEIRKDIKQLLGKVPSDCAIAYRAQHGPGVSLGDSYRGGQCTSFFKYRNLPYTVTQAARPLAQAIIEHDPQWIGALNDWYRRENSIPVHQPINMEAFWASVLKVVAGNRVASVPKTSETDRTIAIEPVMNVFLQLAIDRIVRPRLKKWGYDLNTQDKNIQLALEGSLNDDNVTIDLKGASETVTLILSLLFLPEEWYSLLHDLRSPCGEFEGQEITYEKLSSMGNGYTFVIESLIFGAIARAAMRRSGISEGEMSRKSAVYGDDIIVPKAAYTTLKELLEMCGFMINEDKTFTSGDFRESCGGDFLHGINVRPLFLKSKICSIQDLFYIHNSLVRMEQEKPWYFELNFESTKRLILSYLPGNIRNQFYGPINESLDTHLFSSNTLYIDSQGYRFYYCIQEQPIKYRKHYADYFFIKLMSRQKQTTYIPVQRRKNLNTGNAFDITKRDHTQAICVKVSLPERVVSGKRRVLRKN